MKKLSAFENTAVYFDDKAAEYLEWIKKEHPEHFMESVAQAEQRAITVAGLSLVAAERPDVFVYSELLIQWRDDENKLRRVVPDNMVVIAEERPKVDTNFAIPIQPARPFLVCEYVSKSNGRKDYQGSHDKYEFELKVPYYLLFYPAAQELTLFRLNKRKAKYLSVLPNDAGHCAIPELDLTVKLLDRWVRFWWKGKLLPITTELQAENTALHWENADKTKILVEKERLLDDQARTISDKDRLIAEMQAELERFRKSVG